MSEPPWRHEASDAGDESADEPSRLRLRPNAPVRQGGLTRAFGDGDLSELLGFHFGFVVVAVLLRIGEAQGPRSATGSGPGVQPRDRAPPSYSRRPR